MNKTIRFGAAGLAMFAAIGTSSAASAQDATATARAEILEALTLTNNAALDFGTLVVDGAGAVVVGASDTAQAVCSGQVVCSGTSAAADFTVDGSDGRVVEINLPSADGELRHANFGASTLDEHNIPLTNFTASGATVTLTGGTADFQVGGTITLDGTEIEGLYSTTFDVTVNYQ